MTNPSLSAGKNREQPFPFWLGGKRLEKFLSEKIQHNPLKMLDSDERIQGNPSLSNPHKRGFPRPNGQSPRKPKRADPTERRSLLLGEKSRTDSIQMRSSLGHRALTRTSARSEPIQGTGH
jgi:hypothetical protein